MGVAVGGGSPDELIARVAGRQHGIITTRQLLECGLSRSSVWWRDSHSRLHRLHHGVYAVGHSSISREARWMAAVLAAGDGAVLARICAAQLWNLYRARPTTTEVLTPRRHHGLASADVRQTRTLVRGDVTTRHGIPVTTVSRTLVDLGDVLTAHQLANVFHEAAFRRLLDLPRTRRVLQRNRTKFGYSVVRRAIELHISGSAGTRSGLEERFLELLRRWGAREPHVNVRVLAGDTRLEVDFHWPDIRLCVEVDGSGHERSRTRREDQERDRLLRSAGWRVVRIPASELTRGAGPALESVRRALQCGASQPSQ